MRAYLTYSEKQPGETLVSLEQRSTTGSGYDSERVHQERGSKVP